MILFEMKRLIKMIDSIRFKAVACVKHNSFPR